jgi:hypothetical protein
MIKYGDNAKLYAFAAGQMRGLDSIRLRLYDDRSISPDQRRDLANKLDALMHGAIEFDEPKEI